MSDLMQERVDVLNAINTIRLETDIDIEDEIAVILDYIAALEIRLRGRTFSDLDADTKAALTMYQAQLERMNAVLAPFASRKIRPTNTQIKDALTQNDIAFLLGLDVGRLEIADALRKARDGD